METISCKVCIALLASLDAHNIAPEQWVAGLDVSLDTLRDPAATIDEATYTQLTQRYANLIENAVSLAEPASGDWETVINQMEIYLSIVSLDGTVVATKGSHPLIAVGKGVVEGLSEDYGESLLGHIQYVGRTGKPFITDIPITRPPNILEWYENHLIPLHNNAGTVDRVAIASIDITDRVLYEQDVRSRANKLQAVAQVSAQLGKIHDVQTLLQNICDLTRESFHLYHVHIYLWNAAQQRLVVRAGTGDVGREMIGKQRSFALDGVGIVPQAARTRQVIISNDVAQDPDFAFNPHLPNTKSEISVPILDGDRLVGVLDAQSDKINYFDDDDVDIQTILAHQVHVALNNAQMVESLRAQRQAAEMLSDIGLVLTQNLDLSDLLGQTLQEIAHIIPYDGATIWLLDDEGEKMFVSASIGYEAFGTNPQDSPLLPKFNSTPLMQYLDSGGTALIISDVLAYEHWQEIEGFNWVRSWAGAPLVVHDRVVGRFILDSQYTNTYDEFHQTVLDVLARQISMAVENAKLFNAERQQREMAEALRDISIVLTSRLEQDDILKLVLAQVARVLPYDAAAIWLDEGDGILQLAAQFGFYRSGVADVLWKTPFFEVFDVGYMPEEVTIVSNVTRENNMIIHPQLGWIQSWAGAPIIGNGQIIGQLLLAYATPNFYSVKNHKSILEILVTQISIAVGNARLFEEERRRRLEIEALQRGNISLISSLELSEVLDAILMAAFELVPALDGHIYLYDDGVLQFGAGIERRGKRVLRPHEHPRQDGLTYHVATTGETVMVDDMGSHPFFNMITDSAWLNTVKGIASIPLKIGRRVVGVMNLMFAESAHVHQVGKSSINLLANQASIAIENARLYIEVQKHASELEARVRQRTEELENERAQLQVILNGMGEGVLYDENFSVKYVNQSLIDLVGEPQPKSDYFDWLRDVTPADFDVEQWIINVRRRADLNGKWRDEIRIRHKDGHTFDAAISSTPVRGIDQSIQGAVTILRDISQEKALQAQKDLFITLASHELRTPLTNIRTRLYLARKRPEKMSDHIAVVESVTEDMINLVEDLLDLSRFERGIITLNREAVDVREIIQKVMTYQQLEAERKQLQLVAQLPATPLMATIDRRRFNQVVTNLVSNAIQYTQAGNITATLQDRETVFVLQVSDTGVGLAEDHAKQVFEPFFRAQENTHKGTGLGLSITRDIVQAHEGSITVSSTLGKGTTFSVTVPKAPPEEDAEPA